MIAARPLAMFLQYYVQILDTLKFTLYHVSKRGVEDLFLMVGFGLVFVSWRFMLVVSNKCIIQIAPDQQKYNENAGKS